MGQLVLLANTELKYTTCTTRMYQVVAQVENMAVYGIGIAIFNLQSVNSGKARTRVNCPQLFF